MSDQNLKVGIDITPILYNRGVSRYTSNIIRALSKLDDIDLRFFGSSFRSHKNLRDIARDLSAETKNKNKPSLLSFPPSFLSRMWYGVGRLHIESLMPKVDVFHAWEEFIPPTYTTPMVATIHDLSPLKFPQMAHPSTRERHTQAYKRLKAYHSHVIAVSEQTKRDCLEVLDLDPSRVHVIPEALPLESMVESKFLLSQEQLVKFGINKPYILWIGTQEPRKNLRRVVQAWQQFSKEVDLVIGGVVGFDGIKPQQGIKLLGYVSPAELGSLYKHASVFVFPSLYEGFGLPILESFYYGCPVVTSNNSGMLEVGDDAVILVDPYSVDAIAQGIGDALQTGRSKQRVSSMKKRLNSFSWEKSAQLTLSVYRKAKADGLPQKVFKNPPARKA